MPVECLKIIIKQKLENLNHSIKNQNYINEISE